jgi:hypothetical protein
MLIAKTTSPSLLKRGGDLTWGGGAKRGRVRSLARRFRIPGMRGGRWDPGLDRKLTIAGSYLHGHKLSPASEAGLGAVHQQRSCACIRVGTAGRRHYQSIP